MKKSFGKDKDAVEAETTDVAVVENEEVAVNRPMPKVLQTKAKGFTGEATTEELETPYISLVGKNSDLADEFDPGSYVYDKSAEVCAKGGEFEITLIKAKLSYQEHLDFDDKGDPEMFATLTDAVRQGWHTDYNAWKSGSDTKYVKPRMETVVMIEVGEELSQYEHNGKHYALAMWTFQGSGWTKAGKKMYNAFVKGWLREDMHLGTWKMSSFHNTEGDFKYWHVVCKRGELHDPKFVEFLEDEAIV